MRARTMVKLGLLASALLAGCYRGASERAPALFALEDPVGDDHGDGQITYPIRDDLKHGDLDLIRFAAREVPEGTELELVFSRAIRRPDARAVDIAGTALASVAKLGFYTFNVDIYVDTDRVEGSGRRDLLPGRQAQVSASGAWEKAICLTPRPADARELLRALWQGEMTRERAERGPIDVSTAGFLDREAGRQVQRDVFFPTKVHVFGPTVRFTVPRDFLGGVASPSWGYVVVVTAANIDTKVNFKSLLGVEQPRGGLMIVPLATIANAEHLGGGRAVDPWQPPILDLIVPPGQIQEEVLTGPTRKLGERVQIPPVVPAGELTPTPVPAESPGGAPEG